MSSQKDFLHYIGEPGMGQDIKNLLHTGHVGELHKTRMSHMRELMHGSDVTNEQREAYLTEIELCKHLLLQMRHNVYMYNNRNVVFYDDSSVAWNKNNDWRLRE